MENIGTVTFVEGVEFPLQVEVVEGFPWHARIYFLLLGARKS